MLGWHGINTECQGDGDDPSLLEPRWAPPREGAELDELPGFPSAIGEDLRGGCGAGLRHERVSDGTGSTPNAKVIGTAQSYKSPVGPPGRARSWTSRSGFHPRSAKALMEGEELDSATSVSRSLGPSPI